jgi:hypothetical protein
VETRRLIELSEIAGLEFTCPKCELKITYPLNAEYSLASKCPACNSFLMTVKPPAQGSTSSPERLREALKNLHNLASSLALTTGNVRLALRETTQADSKIDQPSPTVE